MSTVALLERIDAALKGVRCGNGWIPRNKKCGGQQPQAAPRRALPPEQAKRTLLNHIGDELSKKFARGDRDYLKIPIRKGSTENALELYARQGKKYIDGKQVPVTRIINIQFHERLRGLGLADGLLNMMGDRYPDHAVYVEIPQARWREKLLKSGFIEDPEDPQSVYKPPKNQRKDSLMYTEIEGYVRFDTLGEVPYDDMGYIRFDRNCTPGKTIPCGNACRAPQNCKKGKGQRTGETGKALRQNYADQIRKSRGLASRDEANASKSANEALFGKSKARTKGMGPKAASKARSTSAQKAASTRKANQRATETATKRFGQATAEEASLVDNFMASQAKKKARSASATKAAATRRKKASM